MDKVSVLLKAFVVGSGVLLIVGTIALAVMIVLRMGGGVEDAGDTQAPTTAPAIAEITLPPGARVDQLVPDGDRLLLLGRGADGRQFVAVVDPGTGTLRQLLHLVPREAP